MHKRGLLLVTAAALALLLAYPFVVTNRYWQNLMIMVFLYMTLAHAWNWVGGYAGQISFGHAVFFGIGAYTSSVLLTRYGVNPWIGMLAGAVLAGLVAFAVGFPLFRLRGHYFAIATIALNEILRILFDNWEFVGAASGIELPIRPSSWREFQFFSKVPYYFIALAMALIALLITYWVMERSRMGYRLRAIREDQDAARALGVAPHWYKTWALVLSAAMTAVGGTFYAQYILFIDPASVLGLELSILISLIPMLGGAGTLWGPVLGALVMIPLSELSRSFLGGAGRAYNLIFYGLLIMLVAVLEPGGLVEGVRRLRRRWGTNPG